MARKSTLPPADLIVDLLRAGRTVKELAGIYGVSIQAIYHRLGRGGYTAADWMVDAGDRECEDGLISFAEAQRRKAAAEAVVAEIEASTRAGRIVVPEDRSEVTDDELDDAIEKLTWERTCRGIRRQAEEDALWRELPDEFLCPIGDITKYGNGDIKWFYLDPVESGLVGMPWVEWVKIAREIIDADQMARAAVALERAA